MSHQQGGKSVAEVVAISKRVNVEHKHFTLAHELVHRIIRSTDNPAILLEAAMNRFAGTFLIPAQSLYEEVGTGLLITKSFASSTGMASRRQRC